MENPLVTILFVMLTWSLFITGVKLAATFFGDSGRFTSGVG